MAKKLGLALGAGGSRGVAHIGFLKAMEEKGIVPDYISGCSMGSVVGSCYALGMNADQMMK
ncbi:MAG: patatin-like phospholipase family protein [Clostridia bacterium]|nr:patatin-like phospholipase family protein [Clostridia bacterium]